MKKQTEYKIITEDLNRDKIISIISYHFKSYSIQVQLGYWLNCPENSIVISIIAETSKKNRLTIRAIAGQIRNINKQECVLVTEHKLDGVTFI